MIVNLIPKTHKTLACLFAVAALTALSACGGDNPAGDHSSENSIISKSSSHSSLASSGSSSSSHTMDPIYTVEENSEAVCHFKGIIENTHDGFEGAGYWNGDNQLGNRLTLQIYSEQNQRVTLTIYFANGDQTSRTAQLTLNNQPPKSLSFPSTEAWQNWTTINVDAELELGENTLSITAQTNDGLPNIDRIEFNTSALKPGTCPALATKAINVWLAGDSTVANGQTPCPAGWGKYFQELFNDQVTVNNYAAGGRSVRTWMYEVQDAFAGDGECAINRDSDGTAIYQSRWQNMLSNMVEGDYLLIQFGINDGSPSCPRHVGSQAFIESYIYMAEEARKKGAHPIFITPVSAIRCSGSAAVGTRGFIQETWQASEQASVPLIDLHQGSVDLYNELGFCPVANDDASAATTQAGPIGDFFCNDHTHFDNQGARVIAERVLQLLESISSPLADYAK